MEYLDHSGNPFRIFKLLASRIGQALPLTTKLLDFRFWAWAVFVSHFGLEKCASKSCCDDVQDLMRVPHENLDFITFWSISKLEGVE